MWKDRIISVGTEVDHVIVTDPSTSNGIEGKPPRKTALLYRAHESNRPAKIATKGMPGKRPRIQDLWFPSPGSPAIPPLSDKFPLVRKMW